MVYTITRYHPNSIKRITMKHAVMLLQIQTNRILALIRRQATLYFVARAEGVFAQLRPSFQDRILDLGCGTGIWSASIAHSVGMIASLDIDLEIVRSTDSYLRQQGFTNIYAIVASGTHLPFNEGSFTKVLCVDVLDTIPDEHRAVNEIMRVLVSGGCLVLTVLLRDRPYLFLPIRFPEHIRNYNLSELAALLHTSGFEIVAEFAFYHRWSRLLWEIWYVLRWSRILAIPGLSTILGLGICMLAHVLPKGRGTAAGVGVRAEKIG